MMNQRDFKAYKADLRAFLQTAYSDDERLAMLLAHAQSGRLAYRSCCCFVGVSTADHALQGNDALMVALGPHYRRAKEQPGAYAAEVAYCAMGIPINTPWHPRLSSDARRRRIIIPMIKAEFRRRERLRRKRTPAEGRVELTPKKEIELVGAV